MKIIFEDGVKKTYKTYANAVKAAADMIGDTDAHILIAATKEGRFFPVAIGAKAFAEGLNHTGIAITM